MRHIINDGRSESWGTKLGGLECTHTMGCSATGLHSWKGAGWHQITWHIHFFSKHCIIGMDIHQILYDWIITRSAMKCECSESVNCLTGLLTWTEPSNYRHIYYAQCSSHVIIIIKKQTNTTLNFFSFLPVCISQLLLSKSEHVTTVWFHLWIFFKPHIWYDQAMLSYSKYNLSNSAWIETGGPTSRSVQVTEMWSKLQYGQLSKSLIRSLIVGC